MWASERLGTPEAQLRMLLGVWVNRFLCIETLAFIIKFLSPKVDAVGTGQAQRAYDLPKSQKKIRGFHKMQHRATTDHFLNGYNFPCRKFISFCI